MLHLPGDLLAEGLHMPAWQRPPGRASSPEGELPALL
jgi:hypothetical protein